MRQTLKLTLFVGWVWSRTDKFSHNLYDVETIEVNHYGIKNEMQNNLIYFLVARLLIYLSCSWQQKAPCALISDYIILLFNLLLRI
jgi:hypothetical protein